MTEKKKIITSIVSYSIIIEENITETIFFKDLIFWIDLKGLKTLNTFMKERLSALANFAPTLVKTIKKSNLFQLS